MKFSKKILSLIIVFLLGLIYILSPGPDSIDDFKAIPESLKSDEPGDTYQVPDVVAYFSDYDREKLTNYYRKKYRDLHIFGFLFPPITLNYPPQFARQVVRSEQTGTFLEEYVYPLRGSIFVNGYEPYVENEMKKLEHFYLRDRIHINGKFYLSKATLRFYPADTFGRLAIYLGIWVVLFAFWKLIKRIQSRGGD